MSAKDITLREVSSGQISPRVKNPPKQGSKGISVPFVYTPSDDGTDENLLILLHGLGDTHIPFGRLGKQLKLPQTATLAIRAPEQIPFLYEQAFQWYTSFDPLGELISRPNPTPALDLLSSIMTHLTDPTQCAWPPERIHLLGFAQGGSVAVEFGLSWWKSELEKERKSIDTQSPDTPSYVPRALGSIVTMAGPLLSYPTLQTPCPTPLLVLHRPSPSSSSLPADAMTSFRKGFVQATGTNIGQGEGMPRSRAEMEPLMRFWSSHLSRRQGEGLYEVMSGGPTIS